MNITEKDGVTVINTDNMDAPTAGNSLYDSRERVSLAYSGNDEQNMVTIVFIAYNRLEKTKKSMGYLLKYTNHIKYKLLLLDNGSTDGTLEFFKTVEHPNKKIYHITKNIGLGFGGDFIRNEVTTKYIVWCANDAYPTKNWLDNLLACMESDETIAQAVPMSSNMSNLQNPNLKFNSLEAMQKQAALFNKTSDPRKWQERLKTFGVIVIRRMSAARLIGDGDSGFFHDFADDDFGLRILRAGYKQIVCGDTFTHHDHYHSVENDPIQFQKSLETGRENFKEKHHGLDAWIDMLNYETNLLNLGTYQQNNSNILGIDPLCGIPLLEIRNKFKLNGHFNTNLYGFTTNAKHYHDLSFVCDGHVNCDRINFLYECYSKNSFDIVFLGNYLNSYPEPFKLLENLIEMIVDGGQLFIKLKNTLDVTSFLATIGLTNVFHDEILTHINIDDINAFLTKLNIANIKINSTLINIDKDTKNIIDSNISNIKYAEKEYLKRMYVKEYLICIKK